SSSAISFSSSAISLSMPDLGRHVTTVMNLFHTLSKRCSSSRAKMITYTTATIKIIKSKIVSTPTALYTIPSPHSHTTCTTDRHLALVRITLLAIGNAPHSIPHTYVLSQ